jgi:hypothetical protein
VDLIREAVSRRVGQDVLKTRYSEFAEKYPMLFKALFDPAMDIRQINYMIHMLGMIGSGGKTLHDASKAVGAQLADKYINSVVDTRKKKE